MAELDLCLVMPVYNEAECIAAVLTAWHDVLGGLGLNYLICVLNDGSRDGTAAELSKFAGHPRTEIIHKPNTGHGPTILEGYARACPRAAWVFQCDSDDEVKPEHFATLWAARAGQAAVIGYRVGRAQSASRRILTSTARAVVQFLAGGEVHDVNVPFRLMESATLARLCAQIPSNTFSPNVILSAAWVRNRCAVTWIPVPHHGRHTGAVSLVRWTLWKAAVRSLWQTLRCRPRL